MSEKCHDCGVKLGQYHKAGCDWERCATCGLQRISCTCQKTRVRVPFGFEPIDPAELWREFLVQKRIMTGTESYEINMCGLCSGKGFIRFPDMSQRPCICPNGRQLKIIERLERK